MFACVQYVEDRKRALLPISLVKNFQPSSSRDFNKQKTVLAYWVGEAGESEGYYQAHVTALADSLQELTTALRTSRSPLPRLISGSASSSAVAPKGVSEKEKRKRKKQASRHELGNILSSFKKKDNSEAQQERQSEGPLCPQRPNRDLPSTPEPPAATLVLQEEVNKWKVQAEKLRKELEEEKALSRRLSVALLEKIEIARESCSEENEAVAEYFLPEVSPAGAAVMPSYAIGIFMHITPAVHL